MADWRQSLAGVDEDYLIGISNRGIVKRAYKDLGAEDGKVPPAVTGFDWDAQELAVTAGGENVTIRLPLGESRCSCPSRTICRHVVMAILLARQAAMDADAGTKQLETGVDAVSGGAEDHDGECHSDAAGSTGDSGGRCDDVGGNAEENCSARHHDSTAEGECGGNRPAAEGSPGNSSNELAQKVWQEILAQPRKPLLRALGSRGLRRLAAAMEMGQVPPAERGTVVRMQLPGQGMTVKLLSPLEYSTCSCHRKELCAHKAEAILWCQYLEKQLSAADLAQELEQQPDLDLRELRGAAEQTKDCLEHLLETGLARSGEEQAQELERLAILCHNAGLPGWEGGLRALAEGYEKYLRRAAGQTMEKLAGQLLRLYRKTIQLKELTDNALSNMSESETASRQSPGREGGSFSPQSPGVAGGSFSARIPEAAGGSFSPQSPGAVGEAFSPQPPKAVGEAGNIIARIQALAGEFRSEYRPVGDLELTGITVEHFVSDSGYEGDTVYFLEMATGTWYTYTSARPTFYEGKKRSGYQEKAPVPWGVPLSLEGLASMQIRLRGAKCDPGGRLSSSQETQGEILGRSELTADKLEGWYYREYDRLMREQIPRPGRHPWPGLDSPQQGEDEGGGAFGDPASHPRLVFVQAQEFEQGRFNEITQKLELPIRDRNGRQVLVELPYSKRDEASIRYLERLKQQQQPCFLGRVYLRESQICLYPVDLLERRELESGGESWSDSGEEAIARTEKVPVPDAGACQALQSYLDELCWLFQEIYQVGSATVSDSTLESLQRAQKQGEGYGMTTLSQWLEQLKEQLSMTRHRMRHHPSETMECYCRLWQYVQLCRQKAAYDLASARYQ